MDMKIEKSWVTLEFSGYKSFKKVILLHQFFENRIQFSGEYVTTLFGWVQPTGRLLHCGNTRTRAWIPGEL